MFQNLRSSAFIRTQPDLILQPKDHDTASSCIIKFFFLINSLIYSLNFCTHARVHARNLIITKALRKFFIHINSYSLNAVVVSLPEISDC